jgi:beta-lactamase regulating signal transducer with metallopeptidase domain
MNSQIFEQFCTRLVLTLGHFLWQGAAIAVAAWLLGLALRGRAERFRYSVFLAALLMMPLAAALTASLITVPASLDADSTNQDSHRVAVAPPAESEAKGARRMDAHVRQAPPAQLNPALTDVGVRPTGPETLWPESAGLEKFGASDAEPAANWQTELTVTSTAADEATFPPAESGIALQTPRSMEFWLSVLYAAGVSLMLLRLAFGLQGGSRLRKFASPVHEPELLQCLARQVEQIGLRSRPALAWCEQVAVPTVIGVLRPIILLPAGFATGLTVRQLEALLAHELVHIRRWDPAINILQRLLEAAFFFHPAVWFLSKQIRNERENCTDDAVVGLGFPSVEYAKALLQAAELAVFGRTPDADLIAVQAGESPSQLTRRVRRLLNSREHEIFAMSRPGILALLLAIAGSVAVASSAGLTDTDSETEPDAAVEDEAPSELETPQEESKEKPKPRSSQNDAGEAEAGSTEKPDEQGNAVTVKGEIHAGILHRSFDLTRIKDKSRPHTRVVFPNGVEFTILGITTFPNKDGDDWWLPTGEALPGKPVHFVAPAYEGNPKKERWAVLVKVDGMPPWITAKRQWPLGTERGVKSSPERGFFLASPTFAHVVGQSSEQREKYALAVWKFAQKELQINLEVNRKRPGTIPQTEIEKYTRSEKRAKQAYEQAQLEQKRNQDSAELTFRFPGGPWDAEALFEREESDDDSQSAKFKQIAVGLGPRGDISIDPPRKPDYGAAINPTSQVRVRYDGSPRLGGEFSIRAVAINSAGQRIMPTGQSGTPRDGESQIDFFFPMRPEEIQEVSIESIEFANSVTFSGLATEAGRSAKPSVKITAPAVSESGEFAYGVSRKIGSRVQFTDPMAGIRIQREFAELLNRYAPDEPDGAFQTSFMMALNRHLDRVWPVTKGM